MKWNIKMLYRVMLGKHSGAVFLGLIESDRLDNPTEFAKEMICRMVGGKSDWIGCSSPYGEYTEFHCDTEDYSWHLKEMNNE